MPPGPRQNPRPHPSATGITELLEMPTGPGVTAALAAVARPAASAAPIRIVRIILCSSFMLGLNRDDFTDRTGKSARPYHRGDQTQKSFPRRLAATIERQGFRRCTTASQRVVRRVILSEALNI
jgi:hypothetical protein